MKKKKICFQGFFNVPDIVLPIPKQNLPIYRLLYFFKDNF